MKEHTGFTPAMEDHWVTLAESLRAIDQQHEAFTDQQMEAARAEEHARALRRLYETAVEKAAEQMARLPRHILIPLIRCLKEQCLKNGVEF